MIKPKIFGVTLLALAISAVSVVLVTTCFQNVMGIPLLNDADVDMAEAAEAGDATMMTNQTANKNMPGIEFLSIQSAQSGSLSQINETAYTLELNNVANDTIQFSDRPERIVESISTTDFIGSWTAGPNSFESDVPNDALIVENTQTGNLETAIIESFNPMYDANTNTLTYTIVAENATSTNLPSEFGQNVLVIDTALCAGCGGRQCPPC